MPCRLTGICFAPAASLLVAVKSAYAGLLAGGLHTLAGADHLAVSDAAFV